MACAGLSDDLQKFLLHDLSLVSDEDISMISVVLPAVFLMGEFGSRGGTGRGAILLVPHNVGSLVLCLIFPLPAEKVAG